MNIVIYNKLLKMGAANILECGNCSAGTDEKENKTEFMTPEFQDLDKDVLLQEYSEL